MEKRTIVTLPGDGIGKEVLNEAIRVLEAAGFIANYIEGDIGWEFWCNQGNPLPQRTLDLIAEHKIVLFGAITSKPKDEAFKGLIPELKEKGLVYSSPIVGLRQHFGLDICTRPCRSYIGNPLNFVRRSSDNDIDEPKIDTVIFRQNTEGLYGGVEWSNPPEQVYNALMTHPKFIKNFGDTPVEEISVSTRIFTRKATEKILRAAFDHAKKYEYKSVTLCEKPNVIRETSGMMYKMAKEIQKADYPDIKLQNTNIDAQMMLLTKNPENYDVIVAGNMFGDIVSDAFAGLIGGLGFACSAQYNYERGIAVFEPTHGSAPDIAGQQKANPIAMIESACMMLNFIDENSIAKKISTAVAEVVAEGRIRTIDMMKMSDSHDAIEKSVASTRQMTDAIINKL